MSNLNELSSRVFAAVSSLAISAVLFAYAIVPAEQGAAISGMIA
ncbi:MAG: recombination protein F [Pontixanthobacter sp.]